MHICLYVFVSEAPSQMRNLPGQICRVQYISEAHNRNAVLPVVVAVVAAAAVAVVDGIAAPGAAAVAAIVAAPLDAVVASVVAAVAVAVVA